MSRGLVLGVAAFALGVAACAAILGIDPVPYGDAGTDAKDPGSDAQTNGSADYCQRFDSGFCADFDDGGAVEGYFPFQSESGGGTIRLDDTQSRSRPRSIGFALPAVPDDGGSSVAFVESVDLSGANSIHVEFDIWPRAISLREGEYGGLLALHIGTESAVDDRSKVQIIFGSAEDSIYIEQDRAGDKKTDELFKGTFPPQKWSHVALTIAFSDRRLKATADDENNARIGAVTTQLIASLQAGRMAGRFGFIYANKGHHALDVQFDNIRIDVK